MAIDGVSSSRITTPLYGKQFKMSGLTKGFKLFRHSLGMVTGNLKDALRVTGLPYLVIVAIMLMFPAQYGLLPVANERDIAFGGGFLLSMIAYLCVYLWMAVLWHRYILKGERPERFVPRWNGANVMAYFGRTLLMTLCLLPFSLVFGIAMSGLPFLIDALPLWLTMTVLVVGGPLCLLILLAVIGRLSVILPAAAIGKSVSLGQAWKATRGSTIAIAVMNVLLILLLIIPLMLPPLIVEILPALTIMGAVLICVLDWFVTLLFVSFMTTLYGHYVEGRELR